MLLVVTLGCIPVSRKQEESVETFTIHKLAGICHIPGAGLKCASINTQTHTYTYTHLFLLVYTYTCYMSAIRGLPAIILHIL